MSRHDKQVLPSGVAATRIIDGWSVTMGDDEPRILDEELGARLGFARPRDVRRLIEHLAKSGKLKNLNMSAAHVRIELRPNVYREQTVEQYWLTEAQALKVIAKSETAIADQILDEVIAVFIAARRGQLAAAAAVPHQVPVLSSSPLVGDSRTHRAEIASWCRMAARNNNVSVHRVHGEVRRQFRASGIYHIPLVLYPQARELIESLALGRLLLPGRPERRLALVPESPQQHVLPFPGLKKQALLVRER